LEGENIQSGVNGDSIFCTWFYRANIIVWGLILSGLGLTSGQQALSGFFAKWSAANSPLPLKQRDKLSFGHPLSLKKRERRYGDL